MLQGLQPVPEANRCVPFVRLFYTQPSTYVWHDNTNTPHVIQQAEGGEQGPPHASTVFVGTTGGSKPSIPSFTKGKAFLDDVYAMVEPHRVKPVYDLLAHHLYTHAHIQLNSGKTRVWNLAGVTPPNLQPLGADVWVGNPALPSSEGSPSSEPPLAHQNTNDTTSYGDGGIFLERAAARVCREAGARVTTNTRLSDLNLDHINRHDDRRIEVITNGLPLWGGARLAVDTTVVSPLTSSSQPLGKSDFNENHPALVLGTWPTARLTDRHVLNQPDIRIKGAQDIKSSNFPFKLITSLTATWNGCCESRPDRVLAWQPQGHRRSGRPKYSWDYKFLSLENFTFMGDLCNWCWILAFKPAWIFANKLTDWQWQTWSP